MLKLLKMPSFKIFGILGKKETLIRGNKTVNGNTQHYFNSDDEIMENIIGKFITIGINLPHSRNTLTESALKSLSRSIRNFENSDEVLTAVLHGCGGNFCTGIVESEEAVKLSQTLIEELLTVKKPIIAALDGFITNFGLQLAIMCDIRIMDRTALAGFQSQQSKLEFPPFIYERFIMNVGLGNAMELMCSRQKWLATECLTAGLVNKISDSGCALGQSMLLAQNINFNTSLEDVIEYKSKILSCIKKRH